MQFELSPKKQKEEQKHMMAQKLINGLKLLPSEVHEHGILQDASRVNEAVPSEAKTQDMFKTSSSL